MVHWYVPKMLRDRQILYIGANNTPCVCFRHFFDIPMRFELNLEKPDIALKATFLSWCIGMSPKCSETGKYYTLGLIIHHVFALGTFLIYQCALNLILKNLILLSKQLFS